jgi:hypothetical protein
MKSTPEFNPKKGLTKKPFLTTETQRRRVTEWNSECKMQNSVGEEKRIRSGTVGYYQKAIEFVKNSLRLCVSAVFKKNLLFSQSFH